MTMMTEPTPGTETGLRYLERREETLPLSVAGLRALFSEVITEVLAMRTGRTAGTPNAHALIAHCEQRMPQVFSHESVTRGPAIGAIDYAIELSETVEPPIGGFSWPIDPEWMATHTNDVIGGLVATMAMMKVPVQGVTEYMQKRVRQNRSAVYGATGEGGIRKVMTEFIELPDREKRVQILLRHRPGENYNDLFEREEGSETFRSLGRIPDGAELHVRDLLEWMERSLGRI